MKKKLLALVLVVALAVTSVIGGTMAYLTDTDAAINTMTLGDVDIVQTETDRNGDEFKQDQPLYPAVGELEEENGIWTNANVIDKFVKVTNTGDRAAYIRTWIAVEVGDNDPALFHINWAEGVEAVKYSETPVVIDGGKYIVYSVTYPAAVQPNEVVASLEQVALDSTAGNEVLASLGEDYRILVISQAIQAEMGTMDAAAALNEGFGTAHPWVTLWGGEAADPEDMPDPDENGVYTLNTAADLAAFAAAVNAGEAFDGKTVVLGANIDLNNKAWTPIGDCTTGNYFQGTFDGQGHTISNLYVDKSNDASQYSTAGLFGWVDAAMATVTNLKIDGATVKGSHWVGTVAGYFTGTISNCTVTNATLVGNNVNDDANGDKVGGIVGYLNEDSELINNTVSNTTISGNRDIGGIAGSIAASADEVSGNKVANTAISYVTDKDYGSAGEIVSGRTGYTPDGTNTAINVTIAKVAEVGSEEDLMTVLANATAGKSLYITLNADVEYTTGPSNGFADVTPASAVVIDGQGKYTLTAVGSGVTAIGDSEAPFTLKNLTVADESVSYAENAWEFSYLEIGGVALNCENVTFADPIMVDCGEATFTKCSFVGYIDETNNINMNGVWMYNGDATFTGCTFTGTRGIKICDMYDGGEIGSVVIDGCTFSNLSQKPGVAIDDRDTQDMEIVIKNSTFINCQPGDQGLYIYETDNTVPATLENNTISLTGNVAPFTVTGSNTLKLNDVTINGTEATPNAVTIEGSANVVITGNTTLTGATNGSGIYVSEGATLNLSGSGELTAVGNNGAEDVDDATGGNGIGGEGKIVIDGLSNLIAKGYGKHGYGIGGKSASITISNTTIDNVQGGYVGKSGTDTDYEKNAPEGGCAIGSETDGAAISLKSVKIITAQGGSKSAGIGGSYWTAVTVNIEKSTIENVTGGTCGAGIGGSRIQKEDATSQTVNISIVDSTITATGGKYGAGIGSGYDTYCHAYGVAPICTINISGTSVITATGGKYAAGIGTGYHAGGLAGNIASSVTVNAKAGEAVYKDTYTTAMDVGFGVLDPTRDGKDNTCKITYGETDITVPTV